MEFLLPLVLLVPSLALTAACLMNVAYFATVVVFGRPKLAVLRKMTGSVAVITNGGYTSTNDKHSGAG